MTYTNLSYALFTALALAGCGPTKGDTDDGTGTGTGTGDATTGGAASSSGDAPTTGDPTGDTGTTSGDPTTGPGDTTSGTTTGEPGSSSSSGGGSGSTTDGLECALIDQACAAAGQSGVFDDCGFALLGDPVAAWQTAQDCVLAAVAEQRQFRLITELQGIDSDVGMAYCGVANESFSVEVFFFDGDPCGGGGCGPKISRTVCGDSLMATVDCEVATGEVCLTCQAAGDVLEVCEGD